MSPVAYTCTITSAQYSRKGLTLVIQTERHGGGGTPLLAAVVPNANVFAEAYVELRYAESPDLPSAHLRKPAWDWLRGIARQEYERLSTYEHVEMMDADDLAEPQS